MWIHSLSPYCITKPFCVALFINSTSLSFTVWCLSVKLHTEYHKNEYVIKMELEEFLWHASQLSERMSIRTGFRGFAGNLTPGFWLWTHVNCIPAKIYHLNRTIGTRRIQILSGDQHIISLQGDYRHLCIYIQQTFYYTVLKIWKKENTNILKSRNLYSWTSFQTRLIFTSSLFRDFRLKFGLHSDIIHWLQYKTYFSTLTWNCSTSFTTYISDRKHVLRQVLHPESMSPQWKSLVSVFCST
jgi:hypothetical protein